MIIPLRVDAPQDRYPVMNWLIILVTVGIFGLQLTEQHLYGGQGSPLTHSLLLRNWHPQGLLGHVWIHRSLWHLIGNMIFLWVFGNTICSKLGSARYLGLYLLLGVLSGMSHLLFYDGAALGASGAINGIVGMYLFLYASNEITCLFLLIPFFCRRFSISSYWIILYWLAWNIVGILFFKSSSHVAYASHLGGFTVGFLIAWLLRAQHWITMERYEGSLIDLWQERKRPHRVEATVPPEKSDDSDLSQQSSPAHDSGWHTIALPEIPLYIQVQCPCGQRLKIPSKHAGKSGRCPICHAIIKIPDT